MSKNVSVDNADNFIAYKKGEKVFSLFQLLQIIQYQAHCEYFVAASTLRLSHYQFFVYLLVVFTVIINVYLIVDELVIRI